MTRIERRQARIRRIRERYRDAGGAVHEKVPDTPDVHHVIGKSQNYPQVIPLFLKKYEGDPAVKVMVCTDDNKKINSY